MAADYKRIEEMEACLKECETAVAQLNEKLEQIDNLREPMMRLFQYYGSEEWYADREAELPPGMSAGVLSEDAVYDVITDVRDAAFHMLEQATDILKNRI